MAIGGTNGYFPDNVINNGNETKPWNNTGSGNKMQQFWNDHAQWYPTWEGEDAAMQVKWIRVYQKPQQGSTSTEGPARSASCTDCGKFQLLFLSASLAFYNVLVRKEVD